MSFLESDPFVCFVCYHLFEVFNAMENSRTFLVMMICFLTTWLMASARSVPKEVLSFFSYMNNDVYDTSNEVIMLGNSESRQYDNKQSLILDNTPCSLPKRKVTSQPFDMYYIGVIKFSVPHRTIKGYRKREREVVAKCGFMTGLSDYKEVQPSFVDNEDEDESHNSIKHWFIWKNLKIECQISTEIDGLEEGSGEAYVSVKPLLMEVQMPKSEPHLPEIQMTAVHEVTVTMDGMEVLQEESLQSIRKEIKTHVSCIVNSQIRNVLTDYIKNRLLKKSKLGSLKHDYRTL